MSHPGAGWSSPVARQAHNLKVTGSNPVPATKHKSPQGENLAGFLARAVQNGLSALISVSFLLAAFLSRGAAASGKIESS